ncbi:MAG: hypothetical protein OEY14_05365 [Myxococcales bacterium]|nr:hypothetical protein [Myxococcales bacterium]
MHRLSARYESIGRDPIALPGMGAAAPVFVAGDPRTILVLDPRIATSPLLRARIDPEGRPGAAEVLIPLSSVFEPPEVVAARLGDQIYVGYTAMGNAASTAIGLVRVGSGSDRPVALVPGRGYGKLRVSVAIAPAAALFALDSPQEGGGPGAPRVVHVRVANGAGISDPLVLRGPDGSAKNASIARRDDGWIAVAFSSPEGVHVAYLVCADEG